jgi:hypothetical protein
MKAQKVVPSLINDVIDYLSDDTIADMINSPIFKGRRGNFIKAVVEEYAEKPFVERERIFFQEIVDKLNVSKNSLLRLKHNNRTVYFKFYDIKTDTHSIYNYLVGCGSIKNSPRRFKVSCLRLSRVSSVYPEAETKLEQWEIDNINQEIDIKGVQFLHGNIKKIVVEFSEKGKALYHSILFQRPTPISNVGNRYEFNCTEIQAEFYFFKFGVEANVIEPQTLRDKFARMYEEAASMYFPKSPIESLGQQ